MENLLFWLDTRKLLNGMPCVACGDSFYFSGVLASGCQKWQLDWRDWQTGVCSQKKSGFRMAFERHSDWQAPC